MTDKPRRPVTRAPHGSPAAGPVRVTHADGTVNLLPAFPSDLAPDETIEQYEHQEWASKVDAVVEEQASNDPDAASWSDDRSDD